MQLIYTDAGDHMAGEPIDETPLAYIPAAAPIQVYACGVLITIGAALLFSSRQRGQLKNTRAEGSPQQFLSQSLDSTKTQLAQAQALLQPLLPETSV